MSDLILYTSDDGQTRLEIRVKDGTVWLTQLEIAELFQTTKQNVNLHATKDSRKKGSLLRFQLNAHSPNRTTVSL